MGPSRVSHTQAYFRMIRAQIAADHLKRVVRWAATHDAELCDYIRPAYHRAYETARRLKERYDIDYPIR